MNLTMLKLLPLFALYVQGMNSEDLDELLKESAVVQEKARQHLVLLKDRALFEPMQHFNVQENEIQKENAMLKKQNDALKERLKLVTASQNELLSAHQEKEHLLQQEIMDLKEQIVELKSIVKQPENKLLQENKALKERLALFATSHKDLEQQLVQAKKSNQ